MDSFDRQIRYFLKIAELRSLSRAAEETDCTQPALSRQLAALETRLGCPLFLRTGRGMELTDTGCRLLERAGPAFGAIDAVLAALKNSDDRLEGTLRLASVHTLSYYFLGDVMAQFSRQHQRVNLSVMGRSSPDVVDLVENGKADVGFVYDTAVASDKLASTPLFEDVMCLVVGPGCPAEDDIDLMTASLRLIGFPEHYALRRMLHSSGLHPTFVAETETIDSMLRLVSSGMGASILPERIPDPLLKEYQLRKVRIGKPSMRRRVVVITRSDRKDFALIRRLISTAIEVAESAALPVASANTRPARHPPAALEGAVEGACFRGAEGAPLRS